MQANDQFKQPGRGTALWTGIALVAAAVTLNRWSIGWRFADGQLLGDARARQMVLAGELAAGVVGALLILRRPRWPRFAAILPVALLAAAGAGAYDWLQGYRTFSRIEHQREVLAAIDRSENLLQFTLTPELRHLKSAGMNLDLPGRKAAQLFTEDVLANDLLASSEHHPESLSGGLAEEQHWDVSEPRRVGLADLDLWRPFLDEVSFFENCAFKMVRGEFTNEEESAYRTEIWFSGLAELESGEIAEAHANLDLLWVDQAAEPDKDAWRVSEFLTNEFHLIASDRYLFTEVLDEIVPDPADRARARRSIHEELIVKVFREELEPPDRYFTFEASDRQPGVSIVDLDRDGFDDFFVMERWGRNMFFRNRGDGTFEELAAELGLDYEDHCSAALFADFDNDGDQDCFLGRTLAPSLYLANEDGRFVDRSERIATHRPQMVSSLSAADYDGDGLLDVYVSTYAAKMLLKDAGAPERAGRDPERSYLGDFLPEADARELFERYHHRSRTADRAGPPNVLLRNTGAGFALSEHNADVQIWRNTFQSTWADYDQDGDQDVYVANDFSTNNLLRNDGPAGFTDVSQECRAEDIGFGMGASWGDYDNDGSQDLYVSNMFSKAGRRIVAQVAELDPALAQMAQGNSLLDWDGEKFERVSGLEEPQLMVEMGGWSWGSQFIDVDNDCFLDVIALSGHYTSPAEIAIPVDT